MMKRVLLLTCTFCLLSSWPAQANFGLFRRPATVTRSYYYPVPVYVAPTYYPMVVPTYPVVPAPVYPSAPPVPVPVVPPPAPPSVAPSPVMPYAPPSSAPPSATPEPPPPPGGTSVSQRISDRYYDQYPVAPRSEATVATERCSVAFWNLTPSPLTLRVGSETRVVAAKQSVTLSLPRSFVWQIVGRGSETMQIAARDAGMEILIRR